MPCSDRQIQQLMLDHHGCVQVSVISTHHSNHVRQVAVQVHDGWYVPLKLRTLGVGHLMCHTLPPMSPSKSRNGQACRSHAWLPRLFFPYLESFVKDTRHILSEHGSYHGWFNSGQQGKKSAMGINLAFHSFCFYISQGPLRPNRNSWNRWWWTLFANLLL